MCGARPVRVRAKSVKLRVPTRNPNLQSLNPQIQCLFQLFLNSKHPGSTIPLQVFGEMASGLGQESVGGPKNRRLLRAVLVVPEGPHQLAQLREDGAAQATNG